MMIHAVIYGSCWYLRRMLVFTAHAGIYDACWYLRFMLVFMMVHAGIYDACWQLALWRRRVPPVGLRAAPSHAISKAEFWDGLCLRYGWTPSRLPSTCLCEKPLTVAHALSCPFGGFPSIRHNEIRDILASSLKRVAHNVSVEPHLQPITGERFNLRSASTEDQARWTWLPAGFGEVDLSTFFLM